MKYVTLSAKTSLMLGVHKAGFRREGHISCHYYFVFDICLMLRYYLYLANLYQKK